MNSEINTDWWKAYDGLVDLWYYKHYRVHHWVNVPQVYTSLNLLDENGILIELSHFGALQREDSLSLTE